MSRTRQLARRLVGDLTTPADLTLLQWNVLADGLAFDNFVHAPEDCLRWPSRGERILELLGDSLEEPADVLCLQEVDHFEWLVRRLARHGYEGVFHPKAPGRDGCALFVLRDRYRVEHVECLRYHAADGGPQSQIALLADLAPCAGGPGVRVATTHLKAKEGYEDIRLEQVRQLLAALGEGTPTVVAGDFNDVPGSPAHREMATRLVSACASVLGHEPPWTTWKVRAVGETRRTIDYLWCSDGVRPLACLDVPADDEIDDGRLPSWRYPSDHLSLVVRFAVR